MNVAEVCGLIVAMCAFAALILNVVEIARGK